MKQKCQNPNGLQNINAIERANKFKISVRFNDELKAKRYLKSEGYRYQDSFSYKAERYTLWKSKYGWLEMRSTFDYLNDNTLEMGTVWTLQSLET
tara:strand:- start:198 stop:482 length:285 start_codon:yes stop_codon:yes gene_type:complete